ncbi:hypothetical protein [Microvirga zambiensis]|uniref:hypothetical protein n=1 Tax=Microvirga zambiensis TaxID=1402137 RepID=UPI00191CA8E1|nr:hypothetical protein [Microvirga zambiensis]
MRKPKPFSVEIKKSRAPGQGSHLPPRRLFEPAPVASRNLQIETPHVKAEPAAAPRILPSIVKAGESRPEPVEPVRSKRSEATANQKQMAFDLAPLVQADEEKAIPVAPVIANALSHADSPAAEKDAVPVRNAEPVHDGSVGVAARKAREKASKGVKHSEAPHPMTGNLAPKAGTIMAPASEPAKAEACRLTKRQAAAIQLARHERWKRRLHPASW